jgi:hypothetical protein
MKKKENKNRKIKVIFSGELTLEIKERIDKQTLRDRVYDNTDKINHHVLGYFEDGTCEAHLDFSIKKKQKDAICGNNL